MKKPHVLNRFMFNQGGASAYGKGITSNLVTEEQRQKFNYGGRVELRNGSNFGYGKISDILSEEDIYSSYEKPGTYGSRNLPTIEFLQESDEGDIYTGGLKSDEYAYRPKDKTLEEKIAADIRLNPETEIVGRKKLDRLSQEMNPNPAVEGPAQEVMTDSDWMELLEPSEKQKRTTRGKVLLNLAGDALRIGAAPTTEKKMGAAAQGLDKVSAIATADQSARDKAILQGKVLSKVYGDRAAAKGKADIETLKYKSKQTDNPIDVYKATLNLAAAKDPKNLTKDPYIAAAFFNAKGIKPKILKGAKVKGGIEEDKATIEAAKEGDIFILDGNFSQIIDGDLTDVENVQELLEV